MAALDGAPAVVVGLPGGTCANNTAATYRTHVIIRCSADSTLPSEVGRGDEDLAALCPPLYGIDPCAKCLVLHSPLGCAQQPRPVFSVHAIDGAHGVLCPCNACGSHVMLCVFVYVKQSRSMCGSVRHLPCCRTSTSTTCLTAT